MSAALVMDLMPRSSRICATCKWHVKNTERRREAALMMRWRRSIFVMSSSWALLVLWHHMSAPSNSKACTGHAPTTQNGKPIYILHRGIQNSIPYLVALFSFNSQTSWSITRFYYFYYNISSYYYFTGAASSPTAEFGWKVKNCKTIW